MVAWIEEVSDSMERRDGFTKDSGEQVGKTWTLCKYGKKRKVGEEC